MIFLVWNLETKIAQEMYYSDGISVKFITQQYKYKHVHRMWCSYNQYWPPTNLSAHKIQNSLMVA